MSFIRRRPSLVLAALCAALAASAQAEWAPSGGDWGKERDTDLRVMTWNTNSRIYPGQTMTEGLNQWSALAHIIAAMQPDVLLLQEGGDSTSVSALTDTLNKLLHGGDGVGAYVQKYAPDYDMPYVFVSLETDGYNRNVILSRYPFADVNNDNYSQRSDIPTVSADAYAPGGDGGLRGFQFGEIDLPDWIYAGDLVIGNAHLKAYSGDAEHLQRITAAKNVAYFVDYGLNGAGTGVADPNGKIPGLASSATVLSDDTVVVLGGDWNEDELTNGTTRGPADYLVNAGVAGGADGTDRDRSDMTYDASVDPYTSSRATQSSSKLDYIAWQDSIAALRRSFIFSSGALPTSWYPPEVASFNNGLYASAISSYASDHKPVIADFVLPLADATTYDVNVTVVGDGSVTLDPSTGPYYGSSEVTLTAEPAAGSHFIEWQGDLDSFENPATLLVERDMNVTAVFDTEPPPTYELSVTITGYGTGTVTVAPADGPYRVGTSVAVSASVGAYSKFGGWSGDAEGTDTSIDLTMDTNKTLVARFDPLVFYGDMNCDGVLNAFDIDPFVLALTSAGTYLTTYPACSPDFADMNKDGAVNAFDIDPFVEALVSGHL